MGDILAVVDHSRLCFANSREVAQNPHIASY